MKDSLKVGLEHELCFRVLPEKTVPNLYPESEEFGRMPRVFATGFLVGLVEWACIRTINPHVDWPREQTVGTRINIGHVAATPPGVKVTVQVRLVEVEGRKMVFEVAASDEADEIGHGTHERHLVDAERFSERAARKSVAAKTKRD